MPSHSMAERRKMRRGPVSQRKAKMIMREGEIGGRALTKKQRGLFGLLAGGGKPTRLKKRRK